MADETLFTAFLSIGSCYEGSATTANISTTEGEEPADLPGPFIPFDHMHLAPENPVFAPVQNGVGWMNHSFTATSNSTHDFPAQDHDAQIHGNPMVAVPPLLPCMLAGGMLCERSLDATLSSIRLHLFMHGYRHLGREIVQCPWTGCSDRLRWMNIPRHIQSIHLGVRMVCPNCGRSFTRALGLAKHDSLKNCSLFTSMA